MFKQINKITFQIFCSISGLLMSLSTTFVQAQIEWIYQYGTAETEI